MSFKIKHPRDVATTSTSCASGYYQGNGARKVAAEHRARPPPSRRPSRLPDRRRRTGLVDCGNWAVSASWAVPSTRSPGVYIAHLVRNDTGGASHILFVVRNDASHSDIVFQTSDKTWQAYNTYGGNSLYTCTVNCPPGSPDGVQGRLQGVLQPARCTLAPDDRAAAGSCTPSTR